MEINSRTRAGFALPILANKASNIVLQCERHQNHSAFYKTMSTNRSSES